MLNAAALENGTVIRHPVGEGAGYWVGAPGVYFDANDRAFYLTYRVRRPRGEQPDRGGVARIARSIDGVHFEDIWEVNKSAYDSTSIERSAIRRGRDGRWRYFTSYVDPLDGRWCTSILKAARPDAFDADRAQHLFRARQFRLEGVKDPFIFYYRGRYYMYMSVAVPTPETSAEAHATHDIYNTGQCLSATALAVSKDLDFWQWKGLVFEPPAGKVGQAWDGYCRRINSVIQPDTRRDTFVAFFDGSRGHEQNYEERTGVAVSHDLINWRSLSPNEPDVVTQHGSGSIRYVDAIYVGLNDLYLFYEIARSDGSHELRVTRDAAAVTLVDINQRGE